MSVARKKLKNAFVDFVVPALAANGFRGVFPNYRRYHDEHIDIISFQLSIFDQAFCIGVAKCPTDGITYSNGKRLPADWVTANHCPKRLMLGAKDGHPYHWFKFSPTKHELKLKQKHKFSSLTMYEDSLLKYKTITEDIVELIATQAESWWQNSEEWWHQETPVYNQLFFDIQNAKFKDLYV